MAEMVLMMILYFNDPVNVVKSIWIPLIGLGLDGFGEWQKYKGKGSL